MDPVPDPPVPLVADTLKLAMLAEQIIRAPPPLAEPLH